jgi:hypothetical protein
MKAGGKQEGDFRELSGSLASAFPPRFSYVVSFLLLFDTPFIASSCRASWYRRSYAEYDIFVYKKYRGSRPQFRTISS